MQRLNQTPGTAANISTTTGTKSLLAAPRAGSLTLVPFAGYANDTRMLVRGRVIRARKSPDVEPYTSSWRNFVALVRLMNSAEVPGATVCAHFRAQVFAADRLSSHQRCSARARVSERLGSAYSLSVARARVAQAREHSRNHHRVYSAALHTSK